MIRHDPNGDKTPGEDAAIEHILGTDTDHVRALQRHIAEARLRQSDGAVDGAANGLSQEEVKRLLHELRVHQIELEMQNEALRESQAAIDTVRARYFDLYDVAPVAYCTVSEQGLIWQANLAAANLLGQTRNVLLNQPFSRYIFAEDQDVYYLGRRRLASDGEAQSLELRLVRHGGALFWAELTIAIGQDTTGKPEMRMVLSDISERKMAASECARLRQTLREANAELEGPDLLTGGAIGERAARIAEIHRELNARLQSILGLLQASRSPALTQAQRESMDRLQSAGWYLTSRIDNRPDPAAVDTVEATD